MRIKLNRTFGQNLAASVVIVLAALNSEPATATVIYDESASGDLSNSGLSPTALSVAVGDNQVFGTYGLATAGLDRDYFTFTVPVGLELASIDVLPGTVTGGSLSFMGMQTGTQVTVAPDASDATGLLGWKHFNALNGDILPDMAIPAQGSTGFTPPLGSGSYAFWVQETSPGIFPYGFGFFLQPATANVPDSGPNLLGSAVLLALLCALAIAKRPRSTELLRDDQAV